MVSMVPIPDMPLSYCFDLFPAKENPFYESPTDEAHSPFPLSKALLLLLCKPEKVFRSAKKTRVKL